MTRSPFRHSARVRRWAPGSALRLLVVVLGVALGTGIAGDHRLEEDIVDSFQSRPGLQPPELTVDEADDRGAAVRSRLFFVAPWRGEHQAGPMIVDGSGKMVWFHPLPANEIAMDFRVQRYQGEQVLTWWEGQFNMLGFGRGEYVIADRTYRVVERFRTDGGRNPGDFHEYVLTPRGTALVTIYRQVPRDLSAVGGRRNGTLVESIVQEIDVETGRVLLDWHASAHVDLAESHETVKSDVPYDFFHVNAVDVDDDGNLLISARHTDTVYKIDRRTGEVIWRLGGKRSDFDMGTGARFFSQHDVRRQPDGSITLFDNSDPPQRRERSRAIALRLEMDSMTANLEDVVHHPLGLLSDSQGNAQTLAGGDVVVGWGSQPYFSEFTESGRLLFDAHFPEETNVYRAYREPWRGTPTTRPALAVEPADDGALTAYASWNGATEVTSWQVLAGASPDALRPIASSPWRGFESAITVQTEQAYVAVRAVAHGKPTATSRVLHVDQ